ncbi:hypothetical protein ACFVTF_05955 [Kitasatospora sp. NPDC057940]|uniref:hypothetical protein n=1 Tax=Kitasatospora sp. NPDC057940 TaxID=3346285 RepID=UPI0036DD7E92
MATIPLITTTDPDAKNGMDAAPPLYFELNTNPDPVRISPSNSDPARADFILVGSRRSTLAIDCRKITINIPTGPNSPDLTSDLNSATAQISLPGWTATTNTTAKTITFTPTSGHATIGRGDGVTLQLMGLRINTVVGSSPLRIDVEWAESGDDYWSTDSLTIDVGKFPADFVLRNFISEQFVIENGGSVKLNWEASGASSLKLLYDVAEVNVLNQSTYTVNNVRHSTVFYLRATVQSGTDTVERILSATVTVRIPDLEVANLVVNGTITAKEVTVPTGHQLAVKGDITFEEATMGILGGLQMLEAPYGAIKRFEAPTDGLLMFTVFKQLTDTSFPYGEMSSGGLTFVLRPEPGHSSYAMLPVRKGALCMYRYVGDSAGSLVTVTWVPFGRGEVTELSTAELETNPAGLTAPEEPSSSD